MAGVRRASVDSMSRLAWLHVRVLIGLAFGLLWMLDAQAQTYTCPASGATSALAECEILVSAAWPGSEAGNPEVNNPTHSCEAASNGNPLYWNHTLSAVAANGTPYSVEFEDNLSSCILQAEEDEECPPVGTLRSSSNSAGDLAPGDFGCGNGCVYKMLGYYTTIYGGGGGGGTGKLFRVESVGLACENYSSGIDGSVTNGGCVNAGGNTVCMSSNNQAVVNGDRVPPSGLDDGECAVYASGGSACVTSLGGSATSPPAPDNGTPGTPADPLVSVNNTTNNTTSNYYGPSATAGSSGSVGGEPGETNGEPSPGEDDENEEEECPEGDCTGTVPDLDEVCTFGECANAFFDGVQSVPLVASVVGAGASMPAGSCPSWGITAFGDTNSLSAPMCAIWDEVSPLLSAAFLVLWAWVATRIVLSA